MAGLLAVGMENAEEVVMLVDVGTNTEVVVGNRHRMIAASCPAGPAFEGGQVSYGMPAYEGAIESVEVGKSGVSYKTIGGSDAQGICGSGLVDLLAGLRDSGQMNQLGVLEDGARDFVFAPDKGMAISRADISALSQAKSANFAGQFILLRNYGVHFDQVRETLSGRWVRKLPERQARRRYRVHRQHSSGQDCQSGKRFTGRVNHDATVQRVRRRSEEMARRIEHVELETIPDFFDIFVEGCMFKPMTQNIE